MSTSKAPIYALCDTPKLDKIKWSNGFLQNSPKMGFFNVEGKSARFMSDRMRIAFTPRELIFESKKGAPPRYNLALSTKDCYDQFEALETRMCELIADKKEFLFGADTVKKIKSADTVKYHYLKSFMYGGSEDRTPLFTLKLPLDKKEDKENEFKIVAYVDDVGKVRITRDNYKQYLRGGNEVEVIFHLKGAVAVGDNVHVMIEAEQMIIHPTELSEEDDADYLPDDAILSFQRPVLERQTNDPIDVDADDVKENKTPKGTKRARK